MRWKSSIPTTSIPSSTSYAARIRPTARSADRGGRVATTGGGRRQRSAAAAAAPVATCAAAGAMDGTASASRQAGGPRPGQEKRLAVGGGGRGARREGRGRRRRPPPPTRGGWPLPPPPTGQRTAPPRVGQGHAANAAAGGAHRGRPCPGTSMATGGVGSLSGVVDGRGCPGRWPDQGQLAAWMRGKEDASPSSTRRSARTQRPSIDGHVF